MTANVATRGPLRQVLAQIEGALGAVRLGDVASAVGVERGVVDDMVAYWVRRGRLRVDGSRACSTASTHSCLGCPVKNACASPLTMLVPVTREATREEPAYSSSSKRAR